MPITDEPGIDEQEVVDAHTGAEDTRGNAVDLIPPLVLWGRVPFSRSGLSSKAARILSNTADWIWAASKRTPAQPSPTRPTMGGRIGGDALADV